MKTKMKFSSNKGEAGFGEKEKCIFDGKTTFLQEKQEERREIKKEMQITSN
jgi:hypothetical protein